jgi:hydroxymethylpyrimidine/phosphomethylpyrimidine kinase
MSGAAAQQPVVLTIAGSDSGGGAGIQADLHTFARLGVFGTTAITCITAQNPGAVAGIEPVTPDMVALQIRTVCAAFRPAAAKTGMLYSAAIVRAVARAVADHALRPLVVDPVMIAGSGARLLQEDAIEALCAELLPLADVVTPNLPEAARLAGRAIAGVADAEAAARAIGGRFGCACVVKGGHREGDEMCDVLFHAGRLSHARIPRVRGATTHGTGCTFSAALAALLARGRPLEDAAREAQRFVGEKLAVASRGGHGSVGSLPRGGEGSA